jgi:hypothetical protein
MKIVVIVYLLPVVAWPPAIATRLRDPAHGGTEGVVTLLQVPRPISASAAKRPPKRAAPARPLTRSRKPAPRFNAFIPVMRIFSDDARR